MRLFIFTADNQPASLGSTPELASKEESQPGRPAPPGQTPHRKLVTTLSRRKPRQPSGAQLLPSIPTPTPHLGEAQLLALLRPPSGKGLKSREHTGMDGFVQIGLRQVADLVHSAIRQGRYQECVDLVSEYRDQILVK